MELGFNDSSLLLFLFFVIVIAVRKFHETLTMNRRFDQQLKQIEMDHLWDECLKIERIRKTGLWTL